MSFLLENNYCICLESPNLYLKKKVNKTIPANNAEIGSTQHFKIVADYYIQEKVKARKLSTPLCSIISQIPALVYHLSKTINKPILPYSPNKHSVNSPKYCTHVNLIIAFLFRMSKISSLMAPSK